MSKSNKDKNINNTNNPNENISSSDSYCTPGSKAREIALRAFYLGIHNIEYTVETSNEKLNNPLDSQDNEKKPVLQTIKKPEEKQIPEKDKYLVETGKKEELWLREKIEENAREKDTSVGGDVTLKYLSEYYSKEVLEAKIKRFIDYAEALRNNSNNQRAPKALAIFSKYKELKKVGNEEQQTAREELAKILEQEAIEHAMRLFLLTEPRTETTKTWGKLYYEFFQPSGVGDICDSALASYEKFEEWFKNQVFYNKKEAISKLPLKAYFNSYTNYIQATPTETYKLTSLPDDLILTATDFLTESEVAALSELNRYYFERFNNLRNVSELFRKPETKKELGIILANRFDVYRNLVSLDLRDITLGNVQFANALEAIKEKFSKLKKLRLKVANQAQLTQLISVLDQSSNTSDFLNNIQLEISGIKQSWINFENTKILLQKRSNLSLWFETLDTSFFGNANIKAITIPKGMHVGGAIYLHNNPELSSVTFPEGMHVGGRLKLHNNPKLSSVTFEEGMHVGECLKLNNNPELESVTFPKGMHVGGAIYLHNNPELSSVTFPEGMHVGGRLKLHNNPKLSSVTFEEGVHVGECLKLNNNPELESVTFPKGMHVGGYLRLDENPKLSSVTFPKGMHVGGYLRLDENPTLSSVTFEEGMHVGECLKLNNNPKLESVTFPKNMHVGVGLGLYENPELESVTFPKGMHVGEDLNLSCNPKLESVTFPKGMHVGGYLRLDENPTLSSVTFPENMHVGRAGLRLDNNSTLSSVKIGRGVTIKSARLTGCPPEVLKTFFHDLRGVEKFELSKDTEIVGSGLFIALLLNKELNKNSIIYRVGNWDIKSLFGNEWFTLRDKLLDTGGSKENAFANLEKSEKQMLLQVQNDLQAYLDSHHPDTENAGSLDNNNDKKDLNDNSAKHTQNRETTEAPAQDYNLIKQIVEGLEKLPDPGAGLDSTSADNVKGKGKWQ